MDNSEHPNGGKPNVVITIELCADGSMRATTQHGTYIQYLGMLEAAKYQIIREIERAQQPSISPGAQQLLRGLRNPPML